MRRYLPLLAALIPVVGCAHLATDDSELTIASDDMEATFEPVASQQMSGFADYKVGEATQKAQWIACLGKSTKATVVAMHASHAGFDPARFCAGWLAQTFLSQGFDVVTVNRPGFGASTGALDFWGPGATAAVTAGLEAALAKGPKPLKGAWGYGTGAAAATAFARKHGKFAWLILGGGIYDLEETEKSTADSDLRAEIETLRKKGGDKAIEDSSVGYDVSGLPKRLVIYHGKLDKDAPIKQAQAFSDTLQSSGYQVNFQLIEGVAHDIAWNHHRRLLEVLARSVAE
jgi:hypothetical protein